MSRYPIQIISGFLGEYSESNSPVSNVLLGLITFVFIGQAIGTTLVSVDSIQTFSTGLFGVHPGVAWILAPVLHRDVSHFIFSVVGVLLLGLPMERHWSRGRFILFLVVTGYVSVASGAVVLMSFSDGPTAFYGTSGNIYALAGYALTHMVRKHDDFLRIEWVSVLIGVAAIIDVMRDVLMGPYFDPQWFNGGHLSGLAIGILIGVLGLSKCQ